MNDHELKNSFAKLLVVIWIVFLVFCSLVVARTSIGFDINEFFNLTGTKALGASVVQEVKIIILMLSVSIIGGISFLIKDFYRSIKYTNLYTVAWKDYRNKVITAKEFQELVTVEVYVGRFNSTWVYWFLIQPVLSSALGLIAFFIARSGLGVLGSGQVASGVITIQSLYLYAVFTFLAGFSSHKFIAWLDRLADKIFSTTLPAQAAELKTEVREVAAQDRLDLRQEIT